MKNKLVLILLTLVVAASGCVGNNADNQPADTDSIDDNTIDLTEIKYWQFNQDRIDNRYLIPETEGYVVKMPQLWFDNPREIWLPGTDGHTLEYLPQEVSLQPGDKLTVEKDANDAEFKEGAYTYELKSSNCRYQTEQTKNQGKLQIKKCDLRFDFVKWEKMNVRDYDAEVGEYDCKQKESWTECTADFELREPSLTVK